MASYLNMCLCFRKAYIINYQTLPSQYQAIFLANVSQHVLEHFHESLSELPSTSFPNGLADDFHNDFPNFPFGGICTIMVFKVGSHSKWEHEPPRFDG